jgi:hypothetical protein
MHVRASAWSRYFWPYTSSYFRVIMNDSQGALSHGFPLQLLRDHEIVVSHTQVEQDCIE